MLSNESGITPLGARVLVKPMEVEQKTASGIILSSDSLREREEMANTTGIVMALGKKAETEATVGDKVTFAKYSGMLYEGKDGHKYRLVWDDDITSILDPSMKLVDIHLKKGL